MNVVLLIITKLKNWTENGNAFLEVNTKPIDLRISAASLRDLNTLYRHVDNGKRISLLE